MFTNVGEPFERSPDGPDAFQYGPDDEEAFKSDLQAFKVGRSVAAALKPSAGPPPLVPWEDDVHRDERFTATRLKAEYERKAERARLGEIMPHGFTAKDYTEMAAQQARVLDRLPPAPRETFIEERETAAMSEAVDALYDEAHLDDPVFNEPRMAHDEAVLVVQANAKAKTVIRLPHTDDGTPWGNPKTCRPGNKLRWDLPETVVESFHRLVYGTGGDEDIDSKLRRSRAVLAQLG